MCVESNEKPGSEMDEWRTAVSTVPTVSIETESARLQPKAAAAIYAGGNGFHDMFVVRS